MVLAVDDQLAFARLHCARKPAVNTVILQQERQVLRSVRSLTATTSNSAGLCAIERNTRRPILPNPLIPTLTAIRTLLAILG